MRPCRARALAAAVTVTAVFLIGFAPPAALDRRPPLIPEGAVWIRDPVWIRKPTFANFRRAYPWRAVGGEAATVCQVTARGALARCVVASETPAGRGYGKAALELMPRFRMRRTGSDGSPLAGGYVVVPLHFDLDAPAPVVKPSAQLPGVRVLETPNWLRRPTAADIARYYPSRAETLGREGYAAARCVATYLGALSQCTVSYEIPGDWGFGDAALRITRMFRMRPWTAAGESVEGVVVTVPVKFVIAGKAAPIQPEPLNPVPPPPAAAE